MKELGKNFSSFKVNVKDVVITELLYHRPWFCIYNDTICKVINVEGNVLELVLFTSNPDDKIILPDNQ